MPDIFQSNPPPPPPSQPQAPQPPVTPVPPTPTPPTRSGLLTLAKMASPNSQNFLFRSLSAKPSGITFTNQEPNENVLLLLHADFITNIGWITISVIALLLPILTLIVLPFFTVDIFSLLSPKVIFFLLFFYYLLVVGYIYVSFISWFYNVSIVSDFHVLDIEFSNISYKNINAATIQQISNVTYSQSGFFQTFFDYGTVRVDTETENRSIFLELVPRPSLVADVILDLEEQIKNA